MNGLYCTVVTSEKERFHLKNTDREGGFPLTDFWTEKKPHCSLHINYNYIDRKMKCSWLQFNFFFILHDFCMYEW